MDRSSASYRIFVGAFPEGEIAGRIQALRAHYDPKTARITPPHITLAGTYWRSGPPSAVNEAETIVRLKAVQAEIASFDLVLGGIHTFPPTGEPVIYLGVEATPGLLAARQVLLGAIGEDKHRKFTPHLTLAMRLRGPAAQAMLAELQTSPWASGVWIAPIHELRLMQRGPGDPAWRCIARLALAAP